MYDEFQRASDALKRRQIEKKERLQNAAEQQRQTKTTNALRTAEIDRRIEIRKLQKRLISEGPSTAIRHPANETFLYRHQFNSVSVSSTLKGDKIILPPSALEVILGSLSYNINLMTFHVTSIDTLQISHAIAAEFTSTDENSLSVSAEIAERLNIQGDINIQLEQPVIVTLVDLPAGQFARLKVDKGGLHDVIDLQSYLETALSGYSTLTVGDTVKLDVPGRSLVENTMIEDSSAEATATVLELAPEEAVRIVNVDLEVDILYSTTDEELAPSLPLGLGSLISGELSTDHPYHIYKTDLPTNIWGEMRERSLVIELTTEPPGSADLFISFFPLRSVAPHSHHFSNFSDDIKLIEISHERFVSQVLLDQPSFGKDITPPYVLISPYLSSSSCHYRISVNLSSKLENASLMEENSQAGVAVANTQLEGSVCQNCGRYVPNQSQELHNLHCLRFLSKCATCNRAMRKTDLKLHTHCPRCNQGIDTRQLEKHLQSVHREIQCSCGQKIEVCCLSRHQCKECPRRLARCRFCHMFVRVGDPPSHPSILDTMMNLLPHEASCGEKTDQCPICEVFVMKKEFDIHMSLNHEEFTPDAQCPACKESNFRTEESFKKHLHYHLISASSSASSLISNIDTKTVTDSLARHCRNIPCGTLLPSFEEDICLRCRSIIPLEALQQSAKLCTIYLSQLFSKCGRKDCQGCCRANSSTYVLFSTEDLSRSSMLFVLQKYNRPCSYSTSDGEGNANKWKFVSLYER